MQNLLSTPNSEFFWVEKSACPFCCNKIFPISSWKGHHAIVAKFPCRAFLLFPCFYFYLATMKKIPDFPSPPCHSDECILPTPPLMTQRHKERQVILCLAVFVSLRAYFFIKTTPPTPWSRRHSNWSLYHRHRGKCRPHCYTVFLQSAIRHCGVSARRDWLKIPSF